MSNVTENATTDQEFLSLADIGTYEEEIIEGYRGEVDANAGRPTPPHDVYLMNVCYSETDMKGEPIDPMQRWLKKVSNSNGNVYYRAIIQITIAQALDQSIVGHVRREMVNTLVSKSGTTSAQALLQGFGVDTKMLNSHQAQVRALDEFLATGNSVVGEEVDWEARLWDKEALQFDKNGKAVVGPDGSQAKGVEVFRVRGMKNFPANQDGTYRPEITANDDRYKLKNGEALPVSLLPARAFLYHRKWVPADSVQFAEDAGGQQEAATDQQQQAPPPPPPPPAAPARPVVRGQAPPQQQQAPAAPQQTAQQPARPAAPPARPAAPRRITQ